MTGCDLSWMIGRRIKVVSFVEPESWFFVFEGSGVISAECPWRVVDHGRIRRSSDDHGQQFGLPAVIDVARDTTEFLCMIPINRCEVREGTADLVLEFENQVRLEIIPISSGYESWQVNDPFGNSLIAQGGGNIATCKRPP